MSDRRDSIHLGERAVSSIRPLATITVLALVGVFLYLKINETEPPLPEGVEDWSATTELDFDMGTDMGTDMGGTDSSSGPQFGMTAAAPAEGAPPPFIPSTTVTANPAVNVPAPSEAPPVQSAPAPPFESAETVDSSQAAMDLPDLPPLPALPPSPSTAPTADSLAQPAVTNNLISASQAATQEPALPPMTAAPAAPEDTYDAASKAESMTPPASKAAQAQSSLFSATRVAVQGALDRGELSQALLLLSDWYGDPSLSASESDEVNSLLSQLAGSVIYSTEHRLEPPYMVQAGERLETIAMKYEVPWQLLAKINGITSADQLQPGQQLKVVRGPFSARIDMSRQKMTLMLDRRYAGQFSLQLDPSVTVEEGYWAVDQKLLTPANVNLPGAGPTTPSEERSLMLASAKGESTQVAILRGAAAASSAGDPTGRVLRLKPQDAEDIFDILSVGSKVIIRR